MQSYIEKKVERTPEVKTMRAFRSAVAQAKRYLYPDTQGVELTHGEDRDLSMAYTVEETGRPVQVKIRNYSDGAPAVTLERFNKDGSFSITKAYIGCNPHGDDLKHVSELTQESLEDTLRKTEEELVSFGFPREFFQQFN